jgi:hypothetical protein
MRVLNEHDFVLYETPAPGNGRTPPFTFRWRDDHRFDIVDSSGSQQWELAGFAGWQMRDRPACAWGLHSRKRTIKQGESMTTGDYLVTSYDTRLILQPGKA